MTYRKNKMGLLLINIFDRTIRIKLSIITR